MKSKLSYAAVASFALVAAGAPFAASAWEPTKTVEFIIPAGTGGGADQMARFIQGMIAKHNLMKQGMVVINEKGGSGAEGFLDVKNSKGDPTIANDPATWSGSGWIQPATNGSRDWLFTGEKIPIQ